MKDLSITEIYELYKNGYTQSQIAEKYNISSCLVSMKIRKYCTENNLEYVPNKGVTKKKELPSANLYKLYKEKNTLKQIADKYEVSAPLILRRIKKYCEENNLEYVPNKGGRRRKELPAAEIYELYQKGYTRIQIANKYNVVRRLISTIIKQYCEENGLEYKPYPQKRDLPKSEIHNLYQNGYTVKQLANKYGVCSFTIYNRLRTYCEENDLEYIKIHKKIDLPMAEIYKLHKEGYTNVKLASIYHVSTTTICDRLKKYCAENNITKEKRSNLPVHRVYYQYINGILNEVLENRYGITEEILMQELYRYCSENNVYICENKLQEIKNRQILLYHLKSILREEREQIGTNSKIKQKYRR